MSQFGMQMPGARARRGSSPDIYTALLFLAFVALAIAFGVAFKQGSVIGKDGSAFGIWEKGQITLTQ